MCDLITASTVLAAGDTGLKTYGAIQSANAQKKHARFQANIAETNRLFSENAADDAIKRGKIAAGQVRQQTGQFIGSQKSKLAASGVELGSGTALDIVSDTAALGELDALTIQNDSEREAHRFRIQGFNDATQASIFRSQARQINPILAGTTSLLTGANKFASQALLFKKAGGDAGSGA